MSADLDAEEIASALLDRTPGEWTLCDGGDLTVEAGDTTVAVITVTEWMAPNRQTADGWLMAQAPALAAEVLRLRAMVASLQGGSA